MNEQIWWFASRAGGIVALCLLAATVIIGVLLATRALRGIDRPAWLLAMHRWISLLTLVAVAVHVLALVPDNFVHFGWAEIFVPFASPWNRIPVGLGVVAAYGLVAVQVTSVWFPRLPKVWWRRIHATSYGAIWLGIVHGALAGTDAAAPAYRAVALLLTMAVFAAAMLRTTMGRSSAKREAGRTSERTRPARAVRTDAAAPADGSAASPGADDSVAPAVDASPTEPIAPISMPAPGGGEVTSPGIPITDEIPIVTR